MKILFDQGTPAPLRRHLAGHTVDTAFERGWFGLTNGDLLDRAEEDGYQLLITTDQNLHLQQNIARRRRLSSSCSRHRGPASSGESTTSKPRSVRWGLGN